MLALNQLTADNYSNQLAKLQKLLPMTNDLQEFFVSTLFTKAQKDCRFQPLYSQICKDLLIKNKKLVNEPFCMRSILEK